MTRDNWPPVAPIPGDNGPPAQTAIMTRGEAEAHGRRLREQLLGTTPEEDQ